jgi:hypothetical protein
MVKKINRHARRNRPVRRDNSGKLMHEIVISTMEEWKEFYAMMQKQPRHGARCTVTSLVRLA